MGFFSNRKVYAVLLTLGTVFLSSAGCTSKNHQDEAQLNVFHGFEKDDVKTWDPANAYDTVSLDLVPSIYETLYQYSYLSDVYKTEPLLAEALPKFSKDRLTVTIPIRKGIRFQDDKCFKATQGKGREVKAQDFVYGIKRLAIPALQSGGWWVADGKIAGINAFHDRLAAGDKKDFQKIFDEEVEGLKAIDDYTLQIKLIHPYPQLLYILSMSFTAPVPHEAVLAYANEHGEMTDHAVGTGPFLLSRWQRNHEIILDKNPNFRGDRYPSIASEEYQKVGMLGDAGKALPFLDRLQIEVIKEAQPRWLNFLTGQTDVMELPKDNFKEAITNQVNLSPELVKKGMHLTIETGVVTRYVSFNMKDKVLGSNKYLRQALSSAIDREQWIQIFTNGTAKKMTSVIPPGIADRPVLKQMKYDLNLARAKELLKKAGYPNGEGLPVLRFDLRGAATNDRQLGDFFVQQFAQIGVKTEVISNTFPAFLKKLKEGNLQVYYGAWSMDYPDAENIYQLLYGPNMAPGPGESSYDDPVFNKLYEQMSKMESGPKRLELTQKMEEMIQEDCPWAMGYYEASYHLSQPWFVNYRGNEIILNKYKYYRVNKEIKRRYLEADE